MSPPPWGPGRCSAAGSGARRPGPENLLTKLDRTRPLCRGPTGWLEELGLAWLALTGCLGHYLRILGGQERLDLPAFAAPLRQIPLSVLPPINLVALPLGLILSS